MYSHGHMTTPKGEMMEREPYTEQEAYEAQRAWFTRPDAELGWDAGAAEGDDLGANGCVYRGEGRRSSLVRCAVGCLIADEDYDSSLEGTMYVPGDPQRGFPSYLTPIARYLSDTQMAHDRLAENAANSEAGADVCTFVRELDSIARQYGLKVVAS